MRSRPHAMSTTESSFSWGAETFGRGDRAPGRTRNSTPRQSLLGARMAALIIDGIVLIVPLLAIAFLLSLAFPHHGFFLAKSGTSTATTVSGSSNATRYTYTLPLPGVLLVTALSLSYFFLCEALRGQTVGKRAMGLRVRSASGGPAGLNATSARTVLRLIDGIGFYLVGTLVALVTGARRRRIGDWAGGTVVVRDDGVMDHRPHWAPWRAALFPAMWLLAVLLAVFALGLGTAVGEREQAVALVRSYAKAREQGEAELACSMLTGAQQREVVAIESSDYPDARASSCPASILRDEPDSHLLNPALGQMSASALSTAYSPLGAVVVYSPRYPTLHLIAVVEGGQLKLDMRGLEKLEFVGSCSALGRVSPSVCSCTFDLARAQDALPEGSLTRLEIETLAADEARCQGGGSGTTS
jgi:uncharacterized RDD family membrane protein YckC